jgi:hypothetical protein
MRRIVSTLLILLIGGLVLWEVLAQGTKTWTRYGLMKEPLPSIMTLLPTSMILPVITTLLIVLLIATTVMALLRSKRVFGIVPIPELMRHAVVVGPTGSGKTSAVKAIIEKVLRNSPKTSLTVIDWKGEYVSYFPRATVIRKIDIWKEIPGENPREKALNAVEMIREMSRDVVEITPASSLLLLRVLEEEYKKGVPSTEKVLKVLERSAEIAQREGRLAESNMYLALARRLYLLLVDEERPAENVEGDSQVVVYDLKSLPSIYLKNLYASFAIANVYRRAYYALPTGAGMLRSLVIAEECQNYVRPRRSEELPSMAERTVYELRGFGVGAILVCPDSELLPMAVLKDVGAIVAMSPDSLPRFALERFLFRANMEEAEDVLKRLKTAKAIVYYRGRLHFLRRLPRPPKKLKLKAGPKGDLMGVTDSGVGSLRAWPILPHRSPGRPAPDVIEVKEVEEKPKVIEIRKGAATEKEPKVVEVKKEFEPKVIEIKGKESGEELRLEEEEFEEEPEAEVGVEKGPETITEPIEKEMVEEPVEEVKIAEEEKAEMLEEEVLLEEPEPAPKGPPIPSLLPYRGSLCPAGRSATLGRSLF